MRERRRNKLMVEPPSSATGDIAFNLIVFFLVCASVQPDSGRQQTLLTDEQNQRTVRKHRSAVGTQHSNAQRNVLRQEDFDAALKRALTGKTRDEDRVVVVKSKADTPWLSASYIAEMIESAGGIIAVQVTKTTGRCTWWLMLEVKRIVK